MQKTLLCLLLATALSACGGDNRNLTPEQREAEAAAQERNRVAVENAKTTEVGGKTFRVAEPAGQSFVFVEQVGAPAAYTAAEIETAAQRVTGCSSTFNAGVLAFLRGPDIRTYNLGELRAKVSGPFSGWRVDQAC